MRCVNSKKNTEIRNYEEDYHFGNSDGSSAVYCVACPGAIIRFQVLNRMYGLGLPLCSPDICVG